MAWNSEHSLKGGCIHVLLAGRGDGVLRSDMHWSQRGSCELEQPVLLFGRCRIWISAGYLWSSWRMLAAGMVPWWDYGCFLPSSCFTILLQLTLCWWCKENNQHRVGWTFWMSPWSTWTEMSPVRLDWWRGWFSLDDWQLTACCVLCSSDENSFDLDSVANLMDGAPLSLVTVH
jgi:hypothetical protein